ncbi:hypothetical protein AAFF_G00016710, partial [Aldrovandia affinis]
FLHGSLQIKLARTRVCIFIQAGCGRPIDQRGSLVCDAVEFPHRIISALTGPLGLDPMGPPPQTPAGQLERPGRLPLKGICYFTTGPHCCDLASHHMGK